MNDYSVAIVDSVLIVVASTMVLSDHPGWAVVFIVLLFMTGPNKP